jgi:hypothetical protein
MIRRTTDKEDEDGLLTRTYKAHFSLPQSKGPVTTLLLLLVLILFIIIIIIIFCTAVTS